MKTETAVQNNLNALGWYERAFDCVQQTMLFADRGWDGSKRAPRVRKLARMDARDYAMIVTRAKCHHASHDKYPRAAGKLCNGKVRAEIIAQILEINALRGEWSAQEINNLALSGAY
ncbi:MAG: hypothetical protein KGJ13_09875 [Patescibacteria group bacterium]|nr:hypothetical protein [Patescibacteria group bacterium]